MNLGELFENRTDIVELFVLLMNHQDGDPLNEESNQKFLEAVEGYMEELYTVANEAATRYLKNPNDKDAKTQNEAVNKIASCLKLIHKREYVVIHASGKGSCVITDTGEIRPTEPVA
jgi:hypothetical protein